jgi:hypothetical protein
MHTQRSILAEHDGVIDESDEDRVPFDYTGLGARAYYGI